MKKIFTLIAAATMAVGVQAQEPTTEKYEAISWNGTAYTVDSKFSAVVEDAAKGGKATNVKDGLSVVEFGTENLSVVAVSGSNPKDVQETEPGVFPGWQEWNDVKWEWKNQGDILYAYVGGTGNPYVEIGHEAVMTEGEPTGMWRPTYVYYGPKEETTGGKTYRKALPVNGVYYKFTPKADGELCMKMWGNKGNHNTFVMEESSMELVQYKVEGYINGQNDEAGAKRWLTAEEIQALHDAAKCEKDGEGNIIPGTDSAPYVIGAGNQPFWGNLIFTVEANKTYWVLQASSQIGFQGYEFTFVNDPSGIQNVAANAAQTVRKSVVDGKVVIVKNGQQFNIAGQRM